MGIRVKSSKKLIRALTLLFLILLVLSRGTDYLSKKLASNRSNDDNKITDALSKGVLKGNEISVSEDGNIYFEESKYFKKYSVKLQNKNSYVDYGQNEEYIFLEVANADKQKLNSKSFKQQDENLFLAKVDGKNTIVVKKHFEYNNFVFFNELNNTLIILVSKEEEPYAHTVVLDPGHGGVDPGAQAYNKSFWEKDVTLKIVREIRPELIFNGCEVFMSREEDTTIKLEDIVAYTKSKIPDAFVSVHINSYDKSNAYNGISVYYSQSNAVPKKSKALADKIQKSILTSDDWKDREVKAENFYVIKHNNMPAVLVECGFASNPSDVKRLSNNEALNNLSKNISGGIIEYLEEE